MSEIMDFRIQQHLAQEFYRQQMLQRIPGKKNSHNYFTKTNIFFWRRESIRKTNMKFFLSFNFDD